MTTRLPLPLVEGALERLEESVARLRRTVQVMRESQASVTADAALTGQPTPAIPIDLTQRGAFQPQGFWYRGRFRRCDTQVAVYRGVLECLARDMPEALPMIAQQLQAHGRLRRYLARTPEQLFPGHSPQWAQDHSVQIIEGWYADTNLSLDQKQTLLRRVLQAAGLQRGTDVVLVWGRTPVRSDAGGAPTPHAEAATASH